MMISTKGRYALHLMVDLAENDGEIPVCLREIGERQELSLKYLEQIVSLLVRAGLVTGIRGSQGGYHLALQPEQITAGMILRAAKEDLAPAECVLKGIHDCRRDGNCASQRLYLKMYQAMNNVIDTVTLSELVEEDLKNKGG